MPIQSKQQPPYYQEGTNVKIYTALITQTGTNAPTAIVLNNTIGTIIWTRDSVGFYIGTLANAFPQNKTWAIAASNPGNTTTTGVNRITDNTIGIEVATTTDGAYDDGLLTNTPIEIRIYP